jgi:hypothetical protein
MERDWPDEEKFSLINLYRKRMTYSHIARVLDRSQDEVVYKYNEIMFTIINNNIIELSLITGRDPQYHPIYTKISIDINYLFGPLLNGEYDTSTIKIVEPVSPMRQGTKRPRDEN